MTFRQQEDTRYRACSFMKGLLLKPKRIVTPKWAYLVALILMTGMTAGCSLQQAVTDGFFGGISSVVSTVVVERLLGLP